MPPAATNPAPACTTPGTDPEWWFSTDPVENSNAVALCNACQLRSACLEHADEIGATHGVWGGGGLRGDDVERQPRDWTLPPFPGRSTDIALPQLQPTTDAALQAVANNRLLPDVVIGFSPIALEGDTLRLWRALAELAQPGTLLASAQVSRRHLSTREFLVVELPVGQPDDGVSLAVLHELPMAGPTAAGERGAHAAALLLEQALDQIASAGTALVVGYPPAESGRAPTPDSLAGLLAQDHQAARIAGGYTGGRSDALLRTAGLWNSLAKAAEPETLLGNSRFDIDELRGELIAAVPIKGARGNDSVNLIRAIPVADLLLPQPGAGSLPAASMPALARTLDLLLDAGGAEKTWLGPRPSGVGREQVYQTWRNVIQAASVDTALSRIACRATGATIALSAPIDREGTSIVRRIDPAAPAIAMDPIGALRRNVADLVAAGAGAQRALGAVAGGDHGESGGRPVRAHLTSGPGGLRRSGGVEVNGLGR